MKASALTNSSFVTNVLSSLDDDSTLYKVFFTFHVQVPFIQHFRMNYFLLGLPEGFLKIITTEIINRTTLFTDRKTELFHHSSTTISGNLKQYNRFLLHFIASLSNAAMNIAS